MHTYDNVQFIGYAIPTIPRTVNSQSFSDPDGCFVGGSCIGIEPQSDDIKARIALVMRVLEQTRERADPLPSTLKIFVMPEFSFRGAHGAYAGAIDYFTEFRLEFAKCVRGEQWEHWLFVVGTIVSMVGDIVRGTDPIIDLKARVREDLAVALARASQYASKEGDTALSDFVVGMLNAYTAFCHKHPVYEVMDKSFVVAGGEPDPSYPDGLSVEKRFISNEDFVLNMQADTFSEDEVGYPPIEERDGENKESAFDPYSVFIIKGIKFGLEVCIDHGRARIRRNRRPENELVQIQLVPTCGSQIRQSSVVAGPGGLVFNCDGQLGGLMGSSMPNDGDSVFTAAASQKAHTQVTQVLVPCQGNDPYVDLCAVLTRPWTWVQVVTVQDEEASKLYAYGAGEVHVYTPLQVPPAWEERVIETGRDRAPIRHSFEQGMPCRSPIVGEDRTARGTGGTRE